MTYGKCVAVDPAMFIEDATVTWEITNDQQLDVKVDFDGDNAAPDMMAMNNAVVQKTGRTVN